MKRTIVALVALVLSTTAAAPGVARPSLPDKQKIEKLRAQEQTTAAKVRDARAKLDAAVAAYERGSDDLARATAAVAKAEARLREVQAQLGAARADLNRRARSVYTGGRMGLVDALFGAGSFAEFMRAAELASAVLRGDTAALHRVEAINAQAEAARADVDQKRESVRTRLRSLEAKQAAMMREMRTVATLLDSVRAQLGDELGKFRFPVRAPYSYADTFGAPRMEGTPYAHPHQGTDIFALAGTPLVACVTGTVYDVGQNLLGGNRLWIRAKDGHTYYYAHLSGYAPAARNGARVDAGTVVGYVGTSGNARGTPPHLHFEIHEPGGKAIDPYPVLRDAEKAWAGL